jgi:hypothetical protein
MGNQISLRGLFLPNTDRFELCAASAYYYRFLAFAVETMVALILTCLQFPGTPAGLLKLLNDDRFPLGHF